MPRFPFRIFACFALVSTLTACGPTRPETAPVTGKVTFQGRPVPEGTITFYPAEGRSATARLRPDGSYTLTTFDEGDGAIVGSHEVTIEAARFAGRPRATSFEEEIAKAKSGGQAPAGAGGPQWIVPERYAVRGTSPLKAEVKSGTNTIDFRLP